MTPRETDKLGAAVGTFPYPHRTVAEVDVIERTKARVERAFAFHDQGWSRLPQVSA